MISLALRHYKINYFCSIWFLSVSCIVFASNSSSVFTEGRVSQLATELISDCDPSVCHSEELLQLITHSSSFQYDQILHILNEKGPLCLRFAVEAVRDYLNKYNKIPISCESLTDEEKQTCQNMHAEYRVVRDRVLSLVNLVVSHNPNLIISFAQHLSENRMPSSYINTDLVSLLQRLEDERSCSEYKIGEERQFIITPFQSQILPYTYYRIKRESEKHYKAFLVLEFIPNSPYKGNVPIDEIPNHYIKAVRNCIDQANSKLRGPNGETLEVVIEDARQVNSCVPKHVIEVGVLYGPPSVKRFYAGMPCSDTTHEIAHVLGLWDEYYRKEHSCRVVQKDSLLSDYGLWWSHTFYTDPETSLLAPSHFQSILYGDCALRDDVALYRRCSRLSYQISDESACLVEQAYCERQNVLGRDKVVEQRRVREKMRILEIKFSELDRRLAKNPEPPEDDPDHERIMVIRSAIVSQQRKAQQQTSDLQKRLEFVLAWPD